MGEDTGGEAKLFFGLFALGEALLNKSKFSQAHHF
jgi:hypothetical protein